MSNVLFKEIKCLAKTKNGICNHFLLNVEADILAKHIEKLIEARSQK